MFRELPFRPQAKQLILGVNGARKSTLFDVLADLRDFAVSGSRADQLFTLETRTRWQSLSRQSFEIEVAGNGGTYLYTLWVDVQEEQPRVRVVKESLDFDEKPLVLFMEEQVHLFGDSHLKTTNYPFEADRSALAILGPKKAGLKLAWFKQWLDHLYCLRIDPHRMGAEGKEEEEHPEDDLSNFAAWYGHIIQEQTGSVLNLQRSLREIIEGFDSLELKRVGRTARVLRAVFSKAEAGEGNASKTQRLEFDFDELSEGERTLIALYTLLQCALRPEATICIHEPDNFLALAEIQPWLFALSDRIDELGGQAMLISHHPELINLFGPQHGAIFSRAGYGPVRVEPYRPDALGRLSPSEQVARGWERG